MYTFIDGHLIHYRSSVFTENERAGMFQNQHILRLMVSSADQNSRRSKQGYRHNKLITMFACFIKTLAGLLAYETLHANLPLSLPPSVSTVNRFLKDKGPIIVQGYSKMN